MPDQTPGPTLDQVLSLMARSLDTIGAAMENKKGKRLPYFNRRHGEEVAAAVNSVLESGQPMHWPAQGYTVNTLYLKYRQGAQFLLAEHPDKEEWAKKLTLVRAFKMPRWGLRIEPCAPLTAYLQSDWKTDFTTFLESALNPGDKFERKGIPLSDDDIAWTTELLRPVAGDFIWEIERDKIIVIRYGTGDDRPSTTNSGLPD